MSSFFTIDNSYKKYLDTLGISGEQIFKKAGIPFKSFGEEGINITKEQYVSFMESMDTYTRDEHILAISDIDEAVIFVPPLFAAMCSKDGNSCFERIATYKKLIGPFVLNVTRDEENLNMEFIFDDYMTPIPRFTVLSEQVLMVGIIRKATGLNIVPAKVASVYDYGDGALEAYFGIKPEKEEHNILSFSLKDMEEPFLTANNNMWEYLEPEMIRRIKDMETDNSFAAKVRSTLIELIPAGDDSVESVAKELAISSRTLQRKLSSEKTTFIKQLNHTRELMTRNYLKDRSISNDEIAFLVGYSDANSLSRAFRGWTGMSIGSYRRKYSA